MSTHRSDKDLLGTSNPLLAKWSTTSTSLLSRVSGTNVLGSDSAATSSDERKRRPGDLSSSVLGQKKSKHGGTGLLTGGTLTSGLSLTSSLTSGSILSSLSLPSSGLYNLTSSKLESPLSKLKLGDGSVSKAGSVLPHESGIAKPSSGLIPKPKKPPRQKSSDRAKKVTRSHADVSRNKAGMSKKKKVKIELQTPVRFSMPLPDYSLNTDEVMDEPITLTTFVLPENDAELLGTVPAHLQDVEELKNGLINAVSASLLSSPDFRDPHDQARQLLIGISERVCIYDPEFVLKVALYTRRELNIRTTTNFLLALASNRSECRPFLRKYYCASIMLPSDWIEVAEIYQAFKDSSLNFGSLPASLRKVMVTKFATFDKYQLAKYNKEKSAQKKKKKEREQSSGRGGRGGFRGRGRGAMRGGLMSEGRKRKVESDDSGDDDDESGLSRQVSGVEYDDQSETEEELKLKTFTLKQLIRKLHIAEPVEHVMCLIGKKYPVTREEFYKFRLPGEFEEERAGKRMKLPTPETWETQVSLKGNKAETWQDLLDHKKLPFMAMLRNLRNLIKAGISEKHHNSVLNRLTNERQVTNSKQFPFRFFSAYEVLQQLETEYKSSQEALVDAASAVSSRQFATPRGRGRGRGRGGGKADWWQKRLEKKKQEKSQPKETPYDERLIQRYRKALDRAVKIATVHNVLPIRGRTVIFCNLGSSMRVPCQAAKKGLGKPRTVAEVALLLALMCKYSCEESELVVYNETAHCTVELEKGTILDNMDLVLSTDISKICSEQPDTTWDDKEKKKMVCEFPYWVLGEKLRDRVQIDNLIILDKGLNPTDDLGAMIGDFRRSYRRLVNPNLLAVNICVSAANRCSFEKPEQAEHENDIFISGFSDAILRFIAERGSGGQLLHVDNIDKAYNLETTAALSLEPVNKSAPAFSPEKPLPVPALVPRWRTARVFISSTFRDMHGERDLLTRFVFPELRALGKQHFINIFEVDLRWGITEEAASSKRTLELCLTELSKSQLFIGLLGNRYGWVPNPDDLPEGHDFDCVRQYRPGASVTELEMHFGALKDAEKSQGRAFFFIRDDSFEKDIPISFSSDFVAESPENKVKLDKLKDRVRHSGLEVYDRYPCDWGGVVDNKPMVAGLHQFGQRALNNLWLAVQDLYPDEDALLDEDTHIIRLHKAFVDSRIGEFVGRAALLKQCVAKIAATVTGLIGLVGKAGCGKSSLVASVIHEYVESRHCVSGSRVLVHIVGAAPGSSSLAATLKRLGHELKRTFGLKANIPDEYKNLVVTFGSMLQEAGNMCGPVSPLVIFVDGLYLMDNTHQPCNLSWLPHPLPQNVVVVMSAVEGDLCHQSLTRHKAEVLSVGALDMFDKAELVRRTLANHNKALDETPFNNQLKFLMMKKEAHNPLFLKMACEELRVFGVFEKVTNKLKSMSHTTQQLLQEILQRLETDHGVENISTALSLLICARDGLLAEELHQLLAWYSGLGRTREKVQLQDIMEKPFPESCAMPPAVFAYLQRSMQSFLNPLSSDSGDVRLTLAHADIAVAVRHRYLRGSAAEKEVQMHRLLAGYFMKQADPTADKSWEGMNSRAFSELPFHLSCGGCFKELPEVLCSLRFIYSKCLLGHAAQLMDDFLAKGCGKALEKEQAKFLSLPRVQEYQAFVSTNLHIIARNPNLTWQQASNSREGSSVCLEVEELRAAHLISEKGRMDWNNKPERADPCYMHLDNLTQPSTCIAVSPGSTYFATGGLDCLVRVFDMATGKELRFYRGHSDSITDVCFVSKTVLCSTSVDTTLSLWDVELGHRIAVLKGHTRRVNACAADHSGKVVASAGWDTKVYLWNVASGEKMCDFNLECPVNDVKFHPEGQLIVTANWDASIKIFDILHRVRKAVLRGHMTSVRAVAYSNDGCHIASAALDGDVKIWSATKGVQVGTIRGHGGPINKLTFSPSGQELITASDDHKVKVWSGELGIPLHVIGSEDNGPATSAALSQDGHTVAVGYHTGYVRVYDVATGVLMWETKPHTMAVRAVTYTNDDSHILSGSDDTKVHILEPSHGSKISTLEGHSKPVLFVAVHRKVIATTSEDCTCCLYPPVKVAKAQKSCRPMAVLTGHIAPVTCCSFGPGAKKFATSSRDMSVSIWDLDVCKMDPHPSPESTMTQCHADWVNACQWSNTAEFMVTASNDFNLKVWDVKTKEEKHKLQGHTSSVNTMAYKNGCVVSGSSDGQVKVWSHRGVEITTLHGHTQRVNSVDVFMKSSNRINADEGDGEEQEEMEGKNWAEAMEETESPREEKKSSPKKKGQNNIQDVIVASCSDDGTVRLWRPLEANTLASLTGHSDRVLAVAADMQGHVASAGLDHSLRLWTPSLVSHMDITGQHEVQVNCIAAGQDGNWALSTDRSGVVNIWQNKGTSFACVFSFKAHEKSIPAACFVNRGSTRFVTASDDMTMVVWEIMHKREGIIVRRKKWHSLTAPVSSLTWDAPTPRTGNTDMCVAGAYWNGNIFYKNLDTNALATSEICRPRKKEADYGYKSSGTWGSGQAYKDWPLSVQAADGEIVVSTTDGNMSVWSCEKIRNSVSLTESLAETVPVDNVSSQQANWVLTATKTKSHKIYTGDSFGQLSCYNPKSTDEWNQLKVHNKGITGVLVEHQIFTASEDCTIKVWSHDFTQIGQFHCQAPLTSLCRVGANTQEMTHVMAGDQLGNVYLLTWRH